MSNSSGLVDFAIALVDFILNLPNVQDSEVFFRDSKDSLRTVNHCSFKKYLGIDLWANAC